jgi:hypothetical protein
MQALGWRALFPLRRAALLKLTPCLLPFAANSMNRSMDLYPFVRSAAAIAKLTFIHARIHAQAAWQTEAGGGIRAMIAGLWRRSAISTLS